MDHRRTVWVSTPGLFTAKTAGGGRRRWIAWILPWSLSVLAGSARGGETRTPPSPMGPCGQRAAPLRLHLEADEASGTRVVLSPDPGLGPARLAESVDLDGRGGRDLSVWFPETHGSGGAVHALYVHCQDDQFAVVWGPEYAFELRIRRATAGGWRRVNRIEDAGDPDSPGALVTPMRFRNGQYRDERRRGVQRRFKSAPRGLP